MTRQQLLERSVAQLREMLGTGLPPHTPVYLFGSRAREDNRWNSDFDLWIDADLAPSRLAELDEQIEESFIPFQIALAERHDAVRNAASRFRTVNPRVFGSVLHGTDKEGSDLDLLVDVLPGATLFDLGGLHVALEQLLGVPVDLATPGDLPVKIRDYVLAEARPV